MKKILTACLLALSVITAGCASKQPAVEYIRADCELPPLPAESGLDWAQYSVALYYIDHDGDRALYRALVSDTADYVEGLIDSLAVHREMLRAACASD